MRPKLFGGEREIARRDRAARNRHRSGSGETGRAGCEADRDRSKLLAWSTRRVLGKMALTGVRTRCAGYFRFQAASGLRRPAAQLILIGLVRQPPFAGELVSGDRARRGLQYTDGRGERIDPRNRRASLPCGPIDDRTPPIRTLVSDGRTDDGVLDVAGYRFADTISNGTSLVRNGDAATSGLRDGMTVVARGLSFILIGGLIPLRGKRAMGVMKFRLPSNEPESEASRLSQGLHHRP